MQRELFGPFMLMVKIYISVTHISLCLSFTSIPKLRAVLTIAQGVSFVHLITRLESNRGHGALPTLGSAPTAALVLLCKNLLKFYCLTQNPQRHTDSKDTDLSSACITEYLSWTRNILLLSIEIWRNKGEQMGLCLPRKYKGCKNQKWGKGKKTFESFQEGIT